MSKRSTGAGGVSFGSTETPAPRSLFILDIWGNFLAFVAEPRIKTNFYSSSVASYCSLASRVCSSTLFVCGVFLFAFIRVCSLYSCSTNRFSHRSSMALTVSALTIISYGLVLG
jgi:hypothetical protein